ncbi:MAG TPA: TonB-dependent receptor [Ramlibacter sp.]
MKKKRSGLLGAPAAAALCAMHTAAFAAPDVQVASLADLTLEQLSNIEVTSVSGRAESLQDAPASIYVITNDDIRRSAARNLADALRLAPNLQVASLNSGQYAVSARGFNNAIGNKLLVLIDGRTVYSPLFSGVFWDMNDVMLEDVDRIEVISGPGGTLWGANAVNGVINVITKSAQATQGTLITAMRSGGGGYEAARYGGTLANGAAWRAYGMAMDRTNTFRADHVARADAAGKRQGGFRFDGETGANRYTLQGDAYEGGKDPANNLAPRMSGGNVLARWDGIFESGARYKVQAYLDYSARDDLTLFRDRASTADVQVTHEPLLPRGHQLLWGFGYRETKGSDDPSASVVFIPADKTLRWANVFAQHQWNFRERWELTTGAKLESNVYTGTEFMPNLRLSYRHSPQSMTWAAASRAVRAPSRLDREFHLPGRAPYLIDGGPGFTSEIANVYEIGHRAHIGEQASYSVTLFRQQYTHLRSGTATVPAMITNQIEGHVDGVEAWGSWQVRRNWRLSAGVLALHERLASTRSTPDPTGVASLGNDPHSQWSLRSSHNLSNGEFDVIVRHVGSLPSPVVAQYTAVDMRFAWHVSPQLELAVMGQNMFDPRHVEFNAVSAASEIERRLFVKATWRM